MLLEQGKGEWVRDRDAVCPLHAAVAAAITAAPPPATHRPAIPRPPASLPTGRSAPFAVSGPWIAGLPNIGRSRVSSAPGWYLTGPF
ncbi:hypothetical protein ANO11243_036160 [Dothideomycetidae sp. 11243]|nr:hypothetical protein ANO11243_036160 [fungal sp. No.11243]